MKYVSEQYAVEPALQNIETQLPESNQTNRSVIAMANLDIPDQDDRYPGSFFRIPGRSVPGKTTWSIN